MLLDKTLTPAIIRAGMKLTLKRTIVLAVETASLAWLLSAVAVARQAQGQQARQRQCDDAYRAHFTVRARGRSFTIGLSAGAF